MAIGIINRLPEGAGPEQFDPVNAVVEEAGPPQGSIFMSAGELDGVFQIFSVWESRADYDRFVEERLIPAQKQVMGDEAFAQLPDAETVEVAIHTYRVS